MDGLRRALDPVLGRNDQAAAAARLRRITTQLRSMEARLNGLDPRTKSLIAMVERIEQAHSAADQLPTDLESLAEAREKIENLVESSTKDFAQIINIHDRAEGIDKKLISSSEEADLVLERCQTAYTAATTVGLAAAFSERSIGLSRSIWFWVAGLVGALAIGSVFGSQQIHSLVDILKDPHQTQVSYIPNVILSLLSVGGPIWFAWLSTKQIGQRFRLSEDYAFKASVARAYEGFRREAARIDEEMEARLLASALARLDELPLRLVETETHGSPWQEIASSDVIKQAIKMVPGFSNQVKDLAGRALDHLPKSRNKRPLSKTNQEEADADR